MTSNKQQYTLFQDKGNSNPAAHATTAAFINKNHL